MSEQHYGRAPCGCRRPSPAPDWLQMAEVCDLHHCPDVFDAVSRGHLCTYPTPWAAAEALEAGLRAIAGWPYDPLLASFSQENIERWVRASLDSGGSGDTEMPLVPGSLVARLEMLLDLADPRGRGLADVDPILTMEQVKDLLNAASNPIPGIESSDTERPKPEAFERVKAAEIEAANAQPIPDRWGNPVRPCCYFCGAELGTSLTRCERCGNEQPPGESE